MYSIVYNLVTNANYDAFIKVIKARLYKNSFKTYYEGKNQVAQVLHVRRRRIAQMSERESNQMSLAECLTARVRDIG